MVSPGGPCLFWVRVVFCFSPALVSCEEQDTSCLFSEHWWTGHIQHRWLPRSLLCMGSLVLWGVGRRTGSPTPMKPLRDQIRLRFWGDNLVFLASRGLETIVVVEELRGCGIPEPQ